MIKEYLLTKSANIHYIERYVKFINQCTKANTNISESDRHHILPKSNDCWPEFENFDINGWNLAILSYRQHYIAHFMLHKILGGSQTFAFMAMNNKNYKKNLPNSNLYNSTKSQWKSMISENNTVEWYYNIESNSQIKIKPGEMPPDNYTRGKLLNSYQVYNEATLEESVRYFNRGGPIVIEDGWKIGCPSHSAKMKGATVWYNPENTTETKRIIAGESPPIGWVKGSPNTKSLKGKTSIYNKELNIVKFIDITNQEIPVGFILGRNPAVNKDRTLYKDSNGKNYFLFKGDPLIKELNLRGISYSPDKVECPFCKVIGYPAGMKRHHFTHCKKNPDRK